MNAKVGFTVLVILLLVDLPLTLGRKCGGAKCKKHESSPLPVDLPRLCDDRIMQYYNAICKASVAVAHKRRRGNYDSNFIQYFHFHTLLANPNC